MTTETKGVVRRLLNFLTAEKDRPRPENSIPAVKTDLKGLDRNGDTIIWLGHSSFYTQIAGRRILIDPQVEIFAVIEADGRPYFLGSGPGVLLVPPNKGTGHPAFIFNPPCFLCPSAFAG